MFQMRGALCFVVAVISLLLFDHDEMLDHMTHNGDHEDILFSNEPPRGKTNNVVSKQVQHNPTCTSTEKS